MTRQSRQSKTAAAGFAKRVTQNCPEEAPKADPVKQNRPEGAPKRGRPRKYPKPEPVLKAVTYPPEEDTAEKTETAKKEIAEKEGVKKNVKKKRNISQVDPSSSPVEEDNTFDIGQQDKSSVTRQSRQSKTAAAGFAKRVMQYRPEEALKADRVMQNRSEGTPKRGRPRKYPKPHSPKAEPVFKAVTYPPEEETAEKMETEKKKIAVEEVKKNAKKKQKISQANPPSPAMKDGNPSDSQLGPDEKNILLRTPIVALERIDNPVASTSMDLGRSSQSPSSKAVTLTPTEIRKLFDVSASSEKSDDSLLHSPKPAYKTLMTYKKSKKERLNSQTEVSKEEMTEIIEAAKRRSILSPGSGSNLRSPESSPMKDLGPVNYDPRIRYPSNSVADSFFDTVGLIKKCNVKLDDPTKSKLHREGGGRLRRHIKPKMAPHMVYKKIQLAKGCIIDGVLQQSEDEFRGPDSSPRLQRSRPSTPKHQGLSTPKASSSGAAMRIDFNEDSSSQEIMLDRRGKLLEMKKTLQKLSAESAPLVKLFDRPDRVIKLKSGESSRRSLRQKDSKRKEWWHLLRANPDEYEEDIEWTEEQVKLNERRKRKLERLEEELKEHGMTLEDLNNLEEPVSKGPSPAKKRKRRTKVEKVEEAALHKVCEILQKSSELAPGSEELITSEIDMEVAKRILEDLKKAESTETDSKGKGKRRRRSKKKSISMVGPDGKAIDAEKCGSLLDELQPLLATLAKQEISVQTLADDKESENAEEAEDPDIVLPVVTAPCTLIPAAPGKDITACITPHMCLSCDCNDHSYAPDPYKHLKQIKRLLCLHRATCIHFTDCKPFPRVPLRVCVPSRQQELDLTCHEDMEFDSEEEEGTECLAIQLAARKAQILQSLGTEPISVQRLASPYKTKPIHRFVEIDDLGGNELFLRSSNTGHPPYYRPPVTVEELSDGIPDNYREPLDSGFQPFWNKKGKKSKAPAEVFTDINKRIRILIERIGKHKVLLKHVDADEYLEYVREKVIHEIIFRKGQNDEPVYNVTFLGATVAKEIAAFIRSYNNIKDHSVVLSENEVRKLKLCMANLMSGKAADQEFFEKFDLETVWVENPVNTKTPRKMISYKNRPPTAEQNEEELQRTIDSVQEARIRADGSAAIVIDNDVDENEEDDEERLDKQQVSFTTKDIRDKCPEVMKCIAEKNLKGLLTKRLLREQRGLEKMIADAHFLVAKLHEDVNQKQLLLESVKLQFSQCCEERQALVKNMGSIPKSHGRLMAKMEKLKRVHENKAKKLEAYDNMLAKLSPLCGNYEHKRRRESLEEEVAPSQQETAVASSLPQTAVMQPDNATLDNSGNGNYIQIPVPLPNQPGSVALINLERDVLKKLGNQPLALQVGNNKFMISLSDVQEAQQKPEPAQVLAPAKPAQPLRSLLPRVQASRPTSYIQQVPQLQPTSVPALQTGESYIMVNPSGAQQQAQPEIYTQSVADNAQDITYVDGVDGEIVEQSYQAENYEIAPQVTNPDLMHSAMADLETTGCSKLVTQTASAPTEVISDLNLPSTLSSLIDDGCQIEEFLDEVVVGREQEVFSQDLQQSQEIVVQTPEQFSNYSI